MRLEKSFEHHPSTIPKITRLRSHARSAHFAIFSSVGPLRHKKIHYFCEVYFKKFHYWWACVVTFSGVFRRMHVCQPRAVRSSQICDDTFSCVCFFFLKHVQKWVNVDLASFLRDNDISWIFVHFENVTVIMISCNWLNELLKKKAVGRRLVNDLAYYDFSELNEMTEIVWFLSICSIIDCHLDIWEISRKKVIEKFHHFRHS